MSAPAAVYPTGAVRQLLARILINAVEVWIVLFLMERLRGEWTEALAPYELMTAANASPEEVRNAIVGLEAAKILERQPTSVKGYYKFRLLTARWPEILRSRR